MGRRTGRRRDLAGCSLPLAFPWLQLLGLIFICCSVQFVTICSVERFLVSVARPRAQEPRKGGPSKEPDFPTTAATQQLMLVPRLPLGSRSPSPPLCHYLPSTPAPPCDPPSPYQPAFHPELLPLPRTLTNWNESLRATTPSSCIESCTVVETTCKQDAVPLPRPPAIVPSTSSPTALDADTGPY